MRLREQDLNWPVKGVRTGDILGFMTWWDLGNNKICQIM